ncbi:hypothetical protein [uncultured Sphingomonas sp.]|uniref:hypothetical protein n=1 Tax=uncultured Sphingomonas sp. TaxID=158754 RepID=UPI0035CC5A5F
MFDVAKRLLLLGLLVPGLAGCAFGPQLQRVATDHDEMVANAEDELMLRNIVRARERFPLHFMTIVEVNGDAQLSVGGALSGSFPEDSLSRSLSATGTTTGSSVGKGVASISPNVNASLSTRPSFRAAVLATEKFQRGIQQPVKPETIAYYLDAGWPDELIMALFIERLDVYDADRDSRIGSIYNEPDRSYGFGAFLCRYSLGSQRSQLTSPLGSVAALLDPQGPNGASGGGSGGPGDRSRARNTQDVVDLLKNDEIALTDGKLSYRSGPKYSVTLVPRADRCGAAVSDADIGFSAGETRGDRLVINGQSIARSDVIIFYDSRDSKAGLRYFYRDERRRDADCAAAGFSAQVVGDAARLPLLERCFPAGGDTKRLRRVRIDVQFRSVEDIIYFLGEYIRQGDDVYKLPFEDYRRRCGADTDGADTPLRAPKWIIRVRDGSGSGLLDTSFRGKRYYIPADPPPSTAGCEPTGTSGTRSMQVVALLEQLLNLHKSADDLPTSLSITGIR